MARDPGFWPVFVQGFPPKPKFHPDQIPDHMGRIVLVTGGNSGIGYETCKEMLKHNAKVYLAARSPEKADAAIASLKVETGKEGIFLKLDLGSMASVKAAAQEFFSKESELHILFNNAGVMVPPVELLTTDEYDLQFGTHVLGHFYLTESLMPALLAAVRTSPDGHARVVTTSSSSVYLERLHFETFKDGPERIKLGKAALYNQSKHGNAVIARQVAKRYGDQGTIQTSLQRHFPAVVHMILKAVLLKPVEYGVLTQLFAGTMPEALNYNGEFLIPWARLGRAHPECYNDEIGERLWDWLQGKVRAFEARQS